MSMFEPRTLTVELRPDTWANLDQRASSLGMTTESLIQSSIELNVPLLEGVDQR